MGIIEIRLSDSRVYVALTALICLMLFSQSITLAGERPTQSVAIGYSAGLSRYFVDPSAELDLWGMTGEVRLRFDRESHTMFSRPLLLSREITLGCTKVLKGEIDACLVGLTYGPSFDFSRFHQGFGVGPFTTYMFSKRKTDAVSGYTLKTGWRLHAYYYVGFKVPVAGEHAVTVDLKYNFTVYDVKWHNPFVKHKHEDMFNNFSLHLGVVK